MLSVFRSTRSGPTVWARRVALFALSALEIAVAIAPLIEPHHEAPETHVEQSGTSHHYVVHNEATCAVCTLRSIGQLPAAPPAPVAIAAPVQSTVAPMHVTVLTRDAVAHAPRAPPVLS